MAYPTFLKDPDAVLDYGFDWSEWLQTGETLSSATWTVPSGITKNSQSISNTVSLAWLSGGTANTDYILQCKITTSESRVDERSMTIRVRNR